MRVREHEAAANPRFYLLAPGWIRKTVAVAYKVFVNYPRKTSRAFILPSRLSGLNQAMLELASIALTLLELEAKSRGATGTSRWAAQMQILFPILAIQDCSRTFAVSVCDAVA